MVTLAPELFMRVSYVYNGYDLERFIPIIQSTSGFLLQISLLCLPSSLTSPFDLSPLLLLLLPPVGSLIYAVSTLITKNDLRKSLETSVKQYLVFLHLHKYIYVM